MTKCKAPGPESFEETVHHIAKKVDPKRHVAAADGSPSLQKAATSLGVASAEGLSTISKRNLDAETSNLLQRLAKRKKNNAVKEQRQCRRKLQIGKAREDWDNSVDLPSSSSAGSIEMPPTQSERGFTYECFQNGFLDAKRKKTHVHFAHGSLVDYDIFMPIKKKHENKKKKTQFLWKLQIIT